MMPLSSNDSKLVRLEFDEKQWTIATMDDSGKVCFVGCTEGWNSHTFIYKIKVHAEGLFGKHGPADLPKKMDIDAITGRCTLVDTKGVIHY